MLNIQLDISQYAHKFKRDNNLLFDFEDDWKLIKQGICPTCLCNLKVSQKGDVYCNSKKHLGITKKRLFIRKESVDKIIK